jgi:PX-associated
MPTDDGAIPSSSRPAPPENLPTTSSIALPIPSEEHDDLELSPIRAHYLKKTLIQLQCNRELQTISSNAYNNVSTLSYLGPPFSPPPKDAPRIDLPFTRYLFRQFVLTFPFLASAPKNFFPEKVQPFVASLLSRNLYPASVLDHDDKDAEQVGTAKLLAKLERNLALFLNYAVKVAEKEDVVRLRQSDLQRLELLAKRRREKLAKFKDVFDVNVVCVRSVVEKGRVRSRAHEVRCLSRDTSLTGFIILE